MSLFGPSDSDIQLLLAVQAHTATLDAHLKLMKKYKAISDEGIRLLTETCANLFRITDAQSQRIAELEARLDESESDTDQ